MAQEVRVDDQGRYWFTGRSSVCSVSMCGVLHGGAGGSVTAPANPSIGRLLPPRPAPRVHTPLPSTLDLQDVRKANAVRERLTLMLHTRDTVPQFREAIVELLCDMTTANGLDPTPEEMCAETLRSVQSFDDDQAPSTDDASVLGLEYGGG